MNRRQALTFAISGVARLVIAAPFVGVAHAQQQQAQQAQPPQSPPQQTKQEKHGQPERTHVAHAQQRDGRRGGSEGERDGEREHEHEREHGGEREIEVEGEDD